MYKTHSADAATVTSNLKIKLSVNKLYGVKVLSYAKPHAQGTSEEFTQCLNVHGM